MIVVMSNDGHVYDSCAELEAEIAEAKRLLRENSEVKPDHIKRTYVEELEYLVSLREEFDFLESRAVNVTSNIRNNVGNVTGLRIGHLG